MKSSLKLVYLTPEIQLDVQRQKGEAMNIRKSVDYSPMFDTMRVAMSTDMPQIKLYYELGRLICQRTEKGAAVAAAEYLQQNYPHVPGLSPRNLRRMRDFYRVYEENPELLDLAMEIGWTLNVVILEADLNTEERCWYLCAVRQWGWSKAELQRKIESQAHLQVYLDELKDQCYTEHKVYKNERPVKKVSLGQIFLVETTSSCTEVNLHPAPHFLEKIIHVLYRLFRQTGPPAYARRLWRFNEIPTRIITFA